METRVITAHIPVNLAKQVDQIAERLERPKSWIMKQALRSWIELEEKHHRMTLEGLADVDAGRLHDHAEIEKWAAGLKRAK